ncbi:MAG: ExbD/TolR family protein [Luteibaculaceae bacterium]
MARHIKYKGVAPKLDLNPMVDLAFLLVTFFMLATSFKTEELVEVNPPFTFTQTEVQEPYLVTIMVGKDGRIFFNVEGKLNKRAWLSHLARKYNVEFTDYELNQFSALTSFGMPLEHFKAYLNTRAEERSQFALLGIPTEEGNNQLEDWLVFARVTQPNTRFSIKADAKTAYKNVKTVMDTFQENDILRFSLVTNVKQNEPS